MRSSRSPEERLLEHCRLFAPERPRRPPARARLEAEVGRELAASLLAALVRPRGARPPRPPGGVGDAPAA